LEQIEQMRLVDWFANNYKKLGRRKWTIDNIYSFLRRQARNCHEQESRRFSVCARLCWHRWFVIIRDSFFSLVIPASSRYSPSQSQSAIFKRRAKFRTDRLWILSRLIEIFLS
jgi:hypothetical protein